MAGSIMKTFLGICRFLKQQSNLSYEEVKLSFHYIETCKKPLLVFSEVTEPLTEDMLNDPNISIISDGAIFLVTDIKNASRYNQLSWEAPSLEALQEYADQLKPIHACAMGNRI